MARGKASKPGDKTTNQNGYEYTKTEEGKWVATHILVMEAHLGRKLGPGEYIAFKTENHSPPVTLDMIELRRRGDSRTLRHRLAQLDTRIAELQAEKDLLEKELADE